MRHNVDKEVSELVSEAKKSAKRLTEGPTISNCDVFELSYLLGNVAESRGAATILHELYPDDKDIEETWKEATKAHISAYKAEDRFISECYCTKKT